MAQHHFHEDEGGLPAPFVFLSQVAARTTRIRLGTGIVTLPLELPVRVAEDAAVLDLMCGGRLEVGIGPGGNLSAYDAFGLDSTERTALLVRHHRVLVASFASDYVVGLFVAANFIAFRTLEHRVLRALSLIEYPIRFAASCTFSLYLYHSPLLHFVGIFVPQDRFIALVIVLVVTTGLASVIEWKKYRVQRIFLQ